MPVPTPHAAMLAEIPARDARVGLLGSDTWYRVYGRPDAAHTVVLVHGYRGDHHGLEPIVARLPEYRIFAPDLPGFGHSTPMTEEPHTVEGYGIWLASFLGALNLGGDAIVLGHSFGSIVVAHAVAGGMLAPKVVLVNPIGSSPKEAAGPVLIGLSRVFYAIGRMLPGPLGKAWLGNKLVVRFMSETLCKTDDRELRRWIHEEHNRHFSDFSDSRTVAEGFRASLSTDVLHAAPGIDVPTLLIAGEDDLIAPCQGAQAAAAKMRNAEVEIIPGVGHLIHYEKPDLAAEAIRSFIEGGPRG